MTLVSGRAHQGVGAAADALAAGVDARAGVGVVAGGAVGLGRIGAVAGGGIADASLVALIRCRAGYRVGTGAGAGSTGVRSRARIVIVARRPVRLRRVGAETGCRLAGAGVMTLVGRAADDRPGPRAGTGDAGIGLVAGITIVARAAVGLGGVGASPARCVAEAGVVALILR